MTSIFGMVTILTDLFPALVAVYPSSVLSGAVSPFSGFGVSNDGATKFYESRVIVHKNLVIVGADSPRGPQTMFKANVSEVFKDGSYTRVLTSQGDLVVFAKSKGCGCGTRLRSWNPYGSVSGSNRG